MNSPLQSRPLPSLPQPVRAYLPVIHDQEVSSSPNFTMNVARHLANLLAG